MNGGAAFQSFGYFGHFCLFGSFFPLVNQNGVWQLIHLHSTVAPPKQ